MVAVPDKTTLLHPVVGRLRTGATVRVVQPAEVIHKLPWTLEDNKSCGLRLTYDLDGESLLVHYYLSRCDRFCSGTLCILMLKLCSAYA